MLINDEQIVMVTAYSAEPLYMKVISVPAHLSSVETHEAISSKISEHTPTQSMIFAPNHDLSSIIIVSGEWSISPIPPVHKVFERFWGNPGKH